MTTDTEESNLVTYAQSELQRAGLFDDDSDYGGMLGTAVLDIIKLFSTQGHSGMSAAAVTEMASTLMRYEPLTPLTYGPDEWTHVADEMVAEAQRPLYQNKRKSDVFSHDEGATWYDGTEGARDG